MIEVKSVNGKIDLKVEVSMRGEREDLSVEIEYLLRAFRSYLSDEIGDDDAKSHIMNICEESFNDSEDLIEESDIDKKILEIEDLIAFIKRNREGK